MQKSDDIITKLEDICAKAVWLDTHIDYDPSELVLPTAISLIAAFEWARRWLARIFGLPTQSFAYNFDDDSIIINEPMQYSLYTIQSLLEADDCNAWESCFLWNDFINYLSDVCELIGWNFMPCYDESEFMTVLEAFDSKAKDFLENETIYEAYIISADPETSIVYDVMSRPQYANVRQDEDVHKFFVYFPERVSNYYYLYSRQKMYNERYTYSDVLCTDSSEAQLGYECLDMSFPFKAILAKLYAHKIIGKYPDLFEKGDMLADGRAS